VFASPAASVAEDGGRRPGTRGLFSLSEGHVRVVLVRRTAGLACLILSILLVSPSAQTPPSEIVLTAMHGPGPLDVTLQWTGGQCCYEVYRSANPATVCSAENILGLTDNQTWVDTAPAGNVFYKVHSSTAPEPPEICNGIDDDCNGLVDDNATGCDAAQCQDCIGGACRSRCGPCDTCVNGTCQTRCGSCETCLSGTCSPCSAGACLTCVSGVCQSTCDATQCQACGPGGTCISTCSTCQTCTAGECLDACDHGACLSCQSGSCRSFCDPVCQTCSTSGCIDNCGPCQRCLGGACQSKCNPDACEDCVDGSCLSRCTPDETCVGGVCQPGTAGTGPG
jgi:hypothetical protein